MDYSSGFGVVLYVVLSGVDESAKIVEKNSTVLILMKLITESKIKSSCILMLSCHEKS